MPLDLNDPAVRVEIEREAQKLSLRRLLQTDEVALFDALDRLKVGGEGLPQAVCDVLAEPDVVTPAVLRRYVDQRFLSDAQENLGQPDADAYLAANASTLNVTPAEVMAAEPAAPLSLPVDVFTDGQVSLPVTEGGVQ